MQSPYFNDAADQQRDMEAHHDWIVRAAEFSAAVGESPLCVALGYDQLQQPLEAYSENEQVVHGLPAQQHKFRAEAGSHCDHQHDRTWRRRIGHGGVKHIQYRHRRQITIVTQRFPGAVKSILRETQHILDRVDDLRPAGVTYPSRDVRG